MSVFAQFSGTVGNIGDLKKTGEHNYCTLSIAENIYHNGKYRTEWHKLTLWNKLAENAHQHLRKGSVVTARCTISYKHTKTTVFTNFTVEKIDYLANYGKQNKDKPSEDA